MLKFVLVWFVLFKLIWWNWCLDYACMMFAGHDGMINFYFWEIFLARVGWWRWWSTVPRTLKSIFPDFCFTCVAWFCHCSIKPANHNIPFPCAKRSVLLSCLGYYKFATDRAICLINPCCFIFFYFIFDHHFAKIISSSCLIQFWWDFLHLIHHDLYSIVKVFPDFFWWMDFIWY